MTPLNNDESYEYWLERCMKSRTGEIKLYKGNTVIRPETVTDNNGLLVKNVTVTHWWTKIITMFPNGNYQLAINGYWTVTTMSRLRQFTPVMLNAYNIVSSDYTKIWKWFDGIIIDRDGNVINAESSPNQGYIDYLEIRESADDCLNYIGFLNYLLFGVRESGDYLNVRPGRKIAPTPIKEVDGRMIKIGRDYTKHELHLQTGPRGGYVKSSIGFPRSAYGGVYLKNNTVKRVRKFLDTASLLKDWLPKEWIEYNLTKRNEV